MIPLNQVSIEELRNDLANIIGRVMYGKERMMVRKYNKEAVVIINAEEYARLADPANRYVAEAWNKKFRIFEEVQAQNSDKDAAEIATDVGKALSEVRSNKSL